MVRQNMIVLLIEISKFALILSVENPSEQTHSYHLLAHKRNWCTDQISNDIKKYNLIETGGFFHRGLGIFEIMRNSLELYLRSLVQNWCGLEKWFYPVFVVFVISDFSK